MSKFNINLHEAIYSLSDAPDLVGVTHIHHGKHVAFMAAECGKKWAGKDKAWMICFRRRCCTTLANSGNRTHYKPEKLTDEEYLHISDDGKPDRGVVAIVARNLNTC